MEEPAAKPIPVTRKAVLALLASTVALLAAVVVWPGLDLVVSGWFYATGKGFIYADEPVFVFLHDLAYDGARALGAFVFLSALLAAIMHRPVCGAGAKGWVFLFLGLLLAPGLIGNVILKDHWGRARPREVTEFGGGSTFSPALVPQSVLRTNGSFVSGDAAFGFYLPSVAYVMPYRRSRRYFWGGMIMGGLFALARLAMGAHFLSDTLFAALLMLGSMAGLHTAMFGRNETRRYWRIWLFFDEG